MRKRSKPTIVEQNAANAMENAEYVGMQIDHMRGRVRGFGTEKKPFTFVYDGYAPHREFQMAIVEASARKDGTVFFMLDGQKLKVELPKIPFRIDTAWKIELQRSIAAEKDHICMPSKTSTRGRVYILHAEQPMEVRVSNAK